MRNHLVTVAAAWLLIGGSAEAGQAESIDSRWAPWLGCWQLWEEELEELDPSGPAEDTDQRALMERTSACVRPAGPGVSITASAGERRLVERQLVADGNRHDVVEGDCRGWERSEWSRDGHRLYTTAELQCSDLPARHLSGLSLLVSASSWVDIQFVELGEHQQLEVRRYAPVRAEMEASTPSDPTSEIGPAEIRQARRESAEAPNLSDIMEASSITTPRVVEALLVETEPRLKLDSKALVELDDAGIDHGVIDLLVAQSYPEQFVVERRDRGGAWSSRSGSGFNGFSGYYDPIWYSDLYPYYITPLGSRYWGGAYNPYLYGGAAASPFVIISERGVEQAAGAGAVKGQGYTRVLPRATENRRAAGRRGATSGARGGSTRTGSSGGSGGNTASTGGYSSGRSGTGRRAVPRQ